MKNPVRTLITVAMIGFTALVAQAQTTQKIATVEVAKIYQGHYKTIEQNTKLEADKQAAMATEESMLKAGNALVEELKSLDEQTKNPVTTAEAKAKAQEAAKAKFEEIQKKEQEINQFRATTNSALQKRLQTFQILIVEEIQKVIAEVAKRRGFSFVIDKNGLAFVGADVSDITEDVMAEINKGRPASVAAPVAPAAAPAATPAAPAAQEPLIKVPGAKK